MFKVLRCPKCDHVITGQDEFVENIMKRYEHNLRKLPFAKGAKWHQLSQENSLLKTYLKQVLHHRSELERQRYKSKFVSKILKSYCLENGLISEEKMSELHEIAEKEMNKFYEKQSKELERVYGDFNSIFSNKIKSDPTVNAVMRKG